MKKNKLIIPSELAYVFGILLIALGNSMIEKANFGMSMVVAPAYLLHLKLIDTLSFFSFGMACYVVEGILLIVLAVILRRFKLSFVLSFVTAVIYGFVIDGCVAVLAPIAAEALWVRIIFFALGVPLVTMGVAFMFNTYFAPEAYDLFVKELCETFGFNTGKCKTIYDLCSLAVSVILSLVFFGGIRGLGVGTLICACINGTFIGIYSHLMDKYCTFPKILKKGQAAPVKNAR